MVLLISLLVWSISLFFFFLSFPSVAPSASACSCLCFISKQQTAAFSPEAFPFPRCVNAIQFPPWCWWTLCGPWPLPSHLLLREDRASPTSAKGVQGSSSQNGGTEHPWIGKVAKGFPTPRSRWGLRSVPSRKRCFSTVLQPHGFNNGSSSLGELSAVINSVPFCFKIGLRKMPGCLIFKLNV